MKYSRFIFKNKPNILQEILLLVNVDRKSFPLNSCSRSIFNRNGIVYYFADILSDDILPEKIVTFRFRDVCKFYKNQKMTKHFSGFKKKVIKILRTHIPDIRLYHTMWYNLGKNNKKRHGGALIRNFIGTCTRVKKICKFLKWFLSFFCVFFKGNAWAHFVWVGGPFF